MIILADILTAIYCRHKANGDRRDVDKDNSRPGIVSVWGASHFFIDVEPVAFSNDFCTLG
jgi:hypothetical protein